MEANEVKAQMMRLGARECGIAPVERFAGAPAGFRPTDIFPACRSVLVFLRDIPPIPAQLENPVPYTHAAYQLYGELDRLGMELCRVMEREGIHAVPVPSDTPYLHWEEERRHGMGILSLRHAAVQAGLGFLGRNTLLISPRWGNMVYIGAVLTDADWPGGPVMATSGCPSRCRRCLDGCPVRALDGTTVNQSLCRRHSFFKTPRGFDLYACCRCRAVCPLLTGGGRPR